jgi:mono/diheme cytochrome c family protein
MRRRLLAEVVLAVAVSGVACKARDEQASSPRDGHALVVDGCLACHSEELLAQQRLTPAQWGKVVKKMVSWGAPIAASDEPVLSAYLAATYGPDAGRYVPARIGSDEAAAQLAPREDGEFAGGDVDRGRATFTTLCTGCHGPDGRGAIGVNLVDRPLLTRATDFADTLRRGRGKMPAFATQSDAQIADLLAYLRGVR